MSHELQRLNASHMAMIECCLSGMTVKQIADEFDRTPEGVSLIVNSAMFQNELARRRQSLGKSNDEARGQYLAEAKRHLEEHAMKAAQVHTGLLQSQDDNIRFKASKSMLDMLFGAGGDGKNRNNGPVIVLEAATIENLNRALEESRQYQARKVEATIVEQAGTTEPNTVLVKPGNSTIVPAMSE